MRIFIIPIKLLKTDMDEAAFGGTIWGQGKGYPPV